MDLEKNIKPLIMNGLNGRMFSMPTRNPKYNKEILLLCGHHSSIERMHAFIEIFSKYGNVTVPDLPGFGGMEPFYKIKEVPSIENYADYLASFIKLRYKRKKLVIVGFSFSVPVYVRMLQKYPELEKKVLFTISLSGFVHYEDFKFNKYELFFIKKSTYLLSRKIPALIISKLLVKEIVIRTILKVDYINRKNRKANLAAIDERIKLDAKLWVINDFRTAIFTYNEMFKLNLCDIQVKSFVYNFTPEGDHFFDKNIVEQHMQIIFKNFFELKGLKNIHVPSITAKTEEVEKYIPKKVITLLKSS